MSKLLISILLLHTAYGLQCYICSHLINGQFRINDKKNCVENDCEKLCLTVAVQDTVNSDDVLYLHKCFMFNNRLSKIENEESVCQNIFKKSNMTHCVARYCSTELCNRHRNLFPKDRGYLSLNEQQNGSELLFTRFNIVFPSPEPKKNFPRNTKERDVLIALFIILTILGIMAISGITIFLLLSKLHHSHP